MQNDVLHHTPIRHITSRKVEKEDRYRIYASFFYLIGILFAHHRGTRKARGLHSLRLLVARDVPNLLHGTVAVGFQLALVVALVQSAENGEGEGEEN